MTLEDKAKKANNLKQQVAREYDTGNIDKAISLEKEYLQLRLEVINEVDEDVKKQKSITIKEVKKFVAARPMPIRRSTGIDTLDKELVGEAEYGRGKIGGFALGNFIQIVGNPAAGKSTLLMKIITNISLYERVSWFDFEMGDRRVTTKLEAFPYNEDNIFYYNSSRELKDIIDEIKFLNAMGVKYFVVDSTMKIYVKGLDEYQRNKQISNALSELTSTLEINIFAINQMNQQSAQTQTLNIKHGNDVEYDSDFVFFILALPKKENGKIVKDEIGQVVVDETKRAIVCHKNRQDERKFTVFIDKHELIQTETATRTIEFKRDKND